MPVEEFSREEEIDLFEYFKVIYKYRNIVIGIVLISVCLNAINILKQPFKYKASVTFFPLNVKEYKSENMAGEVLKPKLVLEDLIISILKSREMADKIINELQLKTTWNETLLEDTRIKLRGITTISLGKGSVITLDVITQDPELSAKIANSYLDKLDNFNRELQLSTNISLVQVIDRAVPPETRMPRGLIKKSILTGISSLVFAVFFVFIFEYIKKNDLVNRLKNLNEKKQ
ncbi:MAG: Wzz/FepE/Etk N-terminal domain-containing protein [bacterium]